jgi:tRNA(adenine34) deaminase
MQCALTWSRAIRCSSCNVTWRPAGQLNPGALVLDNACMSVLADNGTHDVSAAQSCNEDETFMRLAIDQAWIGKEKPGAGEVGCVIVQEGKVLAAAFNEAELRHDPTAHAEIVAIRKLGELLNTTSFEGCTLYCTLQPCSMCTAACIWGKITRIVYGATRSDVHSMYFDARHVDTTDLVTDAFRENLDVCGGVLASECAKLYYKPDENPPEEVQINK